MPNPTGQTAFRLEVPGLGLKMLAATLRSFAFMILATARAAGQEVSEDRPLSAILMLSADRSHLVDANGLHLYAFSADDPRSQEGPARSACYGECAETWPPLVAEAGAAASPQVHNELLGRMEREDGATQVLYAGWPLYTYVQDEPSREPEGHGRSEHGGVFRLMGLDGTPLN